MLLFIIFRFHNFTTKRLVTLFRTQVSGECVSGIELIFEAFFVQRVEKFFSLLTDNELWCHSLADVENLWRTFREFQAKFREDSPAAMSDGIIRRRKKPKSLRRNPNEFDHQMIREKIKNSRGFLRNKVHSKLHAKKWKYRRKLEKALAKRSTDLFVKSSTELAVRWERSWWMHRRRQVEGSEHRHNESSRKYRERDRLALHYVN